MSDIETPYQEYALLSKALGDLCLGWSVLEHTVHDICLHYAGAVHHGFDGEEAYDVLHVALAAMDLRQTISVTKAVIHMASSPLSPKLYERAEELLNYIDNEMRPERNRFIHDIWSVEDAGKGISRHQMGPRVFSPQSRQRAYGTFTARTYADATEAGAFVVAIEHVLTDLADLDGHSAWLVEAKKQPNLSPEPLPQEWKSLAHRGWQGRGTPQPHKRSPRE